MSRHRWRGSIVTSVVALTLGGAAYWALNGLSVMDNTPGSWVAPRPDQFLYVHTGTGEQWLSIDGTRQGLSIALNGSETPIAGCLDGVPVQPENSPAGMLLAPCVPTPAYDRDAPTSSQEVAAQIIDAQSRDTPSNVPAAAARYIVRWSQVLLLEPDARAALFQSASLIAGLTVTTQDGMRVVSWEQGGRSGHFRYDPTTYAVVHADGSRDGQVVVDDVGERPRAGR